ncbi:MAG: adenylosuccinate lyase family protein [Rhodobacteraceae bacterium]|nr:adenylosuccinate lyase family protein [Paracoccaceae bacterium]
MPASPLDSAIYRQLFGDAEVAKLFTDSAEVRAMLVVEGALAKAQGALGMIPETAAAAIHRDAMEVVIDPAALAAETGRSAVPVPALVDAFRTAMQAPDHAQFVHWGATSQDIIETGLTLRLRQALVIAEGRLIATAKTLGTLAKTHSETPMAGRTYGQIATPTSFGAVVAGWGEPLLRHHERLSDLRPRLLHVTLAGAAGTLSAMGPDGPKVRAAMARALDLSDTEASHHATRDHIGELAGWCTLVTGSLGKMGEDLTLLSQSGIAEVSLGATGSSSTMPQKQNPVAPSVLVALANAANALNSGLQGALVHRQQRDGGAWLTEWLLLPQLILTTTKALAVAQSLADTIAPDVDAMAANLDDGLGLIHAEALSFALATTLSRPKAQAEIKRLAAAARASGTPLPELVAAAHPGTALPDTQAQLGTAPDQARAFAARAGKF